MAGIIIEVSEPSQPGILRYRFDRFPVRVGRGYQNDLILSDPFVSPEHLGITKFEGGYFIQDLNSTNGTTVAGQPILEIPCPAASGDLIVLGATTLKILSPDHPVAPARKLGFWTTLERKKSFYLLAWLSLLPAFGIEVLNGYLASYTKIRALDLIKENLGGVSFAIIWAAFWTAVGYSITRRTRFHAQLLMVVLFTIAMTAGHFLLGYLAFALNRSSLQVGGSFVLSGVLFALLLFYTMGTASRMKKNTRLISSTVISFIIMLIGVLVHFAAIPEFSDVPRIVAPLRPPPAQWVDSRSIDDFLADSEKAIDKSDNEIAE